jgi:hypothetical protein
MNLPIWVHELLSKKFTAEQMAVIDKNWSTYIDISFGNSTGRELVNAAKSVLAYCKDSK